MSLIILLAVSSHLPEWYVQYNTAFQFSDPNSPRIPAEPECQTLFSLFLDA